MSDSNKRRTAEPSWIVGYDANASEHEPKPHVHCARCGAREPFTLEDIAVVVRPFIDRHQRCVLRVAPEHFWRDVWHDGCVKRGPMVREVSAADDNPAHITIEDGSVLRHYRCLGCGVECYAGLNTKRCVETRPMSAAHRGVSPND